MSSRGELVVLSFSLVSICVAWSDKLSSLSAMRKSSVAARRLASLASLISLSGLGGIRGAEGEKDIRSSVLDDGIFLGCAFL